MLEWHLFDSLPYMDTPYHLVGWIGWFVIAAVILWILRQKPERSLSKVFWSLWIILLTVAVLTTLFIGIALPIGERLPFPNVPRENYTPTLMIFSFIPLLIAGGLLGTWPAALLGFTGGVFNALWNTHSVFTPLETALIATFLSLALRQNYRTRLFKFLRQPLGAAVVTIPLTGLLFLVSTFFSTNGAFSARLDYAFTQSWILIVVNGIQILVAGLLCQVFSITKLKGWVSFKVFSPSPVETGLQNRILYSALPMVGVLLLTLVIADWVVAGRAARDMLRNQLENSATIAMENIPNVMETGQSLTTALVNNQLPLNDTTKLNQILKSKIREIPFFNQIFVFDLTGAPVSGYPIDTMDQFNIAAEEEAGIQLALNGVLIQHYVIPPNPGEDSAQITFIASIPDEYGLSKGVVITRTNFAINLFSQPLLLSMESIQSEGGQGAILDENNLILFHTNPKLIMNTYEGTVPEKSDYYEDPGATGTRQMVFAAVDEQMNWKVIFSMPASYSQELSLKIAIPLLAISLVISFLAYLLLRYLMKTLTSSLTDLALKASEISNGELDDRIEVNGVDEIGRLGTAFEKMRISLKSRLEELDTLLNVSQGVASSLNMESASQHLLKASLAYGADAASLVLLTPTTQDWDENPIVYRMGKDAEGYSFLDRGLIDLFSGENILIIPSRARIRKMGLPKGVIQPAALAGIPIKDDEALIGFLWVAYAQTHRFLEPEVRFLNTLAGQAVMAVNNATLYLKAEVGKQRLESVLSSTPEPVFVVDEDGKLLIANQAATQLRELISSIENNSDVEEVKSLVLRDFLLFNQEEHADELQLENGRTYLVSASRVSAEAGKAGKVCVLRDVTEYKELEKMKSEFVATVSHGLKTPMGLIRGYASMMQMVGEQNDQQRDYSARIMEEVDHISRMTDNLLDLGRIDSGIDLQAEKITPYELIDHVIGLLQPQANNRKVQFLRELTLAQESIIEADRALLQQALYNLLENAVKFSPIGGKVGIRLQVNEETVVFEIQDHGPGIAPIDLPLIFDRQKRLDFKDKPGPTGSGLGLSIVKSIAHRHNGKVWVDSSLGKGCTFFLEIPTKQKGKNRKSVDV